MCSQFAQVIPLYAQSKLSSGEKLRMELHMSVCAPCRQEAERLTGDQKSKQPPDRLDDQFAQLRARMAKDLASQETSAAPAWLTWLDRVRY